MNEGNYICKFARRDNELARMVLDIEFIFVKTEHE